MTKDEKIREIFNFISILCIFYVSISLIFLPVHAENIVISNTTTETTIQWQWTNTSIIGVDNITIDGYKLCNFDPLSIKFILSDLKPSTQHEIIIYANSSVATQTTTTKENTLDFLLHYFVIQFIGLILVIISLSGRITVLAWLGFFITGIGFIMTMPESVSNYLFIVTNGMLLLFTLIIAGLESKGG
jgi:hypothetical protein